MRYFLFLLLTTALLTGCSTTDDASTQAGDTPVEHRIISLDGSITELLYDLDYGDNIVGVDVTSSYPAQVNEVPKLGHVSKLNVEALLALSPTLVLVNADAKDKPALKTLADAGVTILPVPSSSTLDNAVKAARALSGHLELPAAKLEEFTAEITADSLELAQTVSQAPEAKPRVLFIYARGAKQLMVAGTGTEAESMIQLAGGENAITSFADFKPLTPEALVEAAPEVILMFESGLASLDGKAGLANVPGISQTPAFINDRIIAMDGHYLLGFGPRAAQAAKDLAISLSPPLTK